MRRVLIYTSPARGHLYPMMDVALALRDAGHQVTVQTLAGEREAVRTAGVEHRRGGREAAVGDVPSLRAANRLARRPRLRSRLRAATQPHRAPARPGAALGPRARHALEHPTARSPAPRARCGQRDRDHRGARARALQRAARARAHHALPAARPGGERGRRGGHARWNGHHPARPRRRCPGRGGALGARSERDRPPCRGERCRRHAAACAAHAGAAARGGARRPRAPAPGRARRALPESGTAVLARR